MFRLSRKAMSVPFASVRSLATASKGVNLTGLGITPSAATQVFHNLSYPEIFEHEIAQGEKTVKNGTVTVDTGKFTGRSPKDKYIVAREPSKDNVSTLFQCNILTFAFFRSGGVPLTER